MEESATPGPSKINSMHLAEPPQESGSIVKSNLYIICQKDDKLPITSEEAGRARVKRAAEIRNDIVTKRIKSLNIEKGSESKHFVYHNTNKCYKSYTHSGKLKAIEEKSLDIDIGCSSDNITSSSTVSRKSLRSSLVPCAPPSCNKDPRTLPCIICGNIAHRKCRDKYRICEYGSAKKLTDAAKFFQDEIFTRLADRLCDNIDSCVKAVISADLFCHNICRQNYMRKFERNEKPDEALEKPFITNIKHELFNRTVPYIDNLLAKGECCTMTDIVEFATSLLEEDEILNSTFQNRDIKQLIMAHYGDAVTIAPNNKVNESDIIFSSKISAADLASKLKNQDIMREAGTKLREVLMDVDFGLQDSFCDSTDLKASWERTIMPAPLLAFLAALFKIPKYTLFKSSARDLEDLLQPLNDEDDVANEQNPQEHDLVRDHKSTQSHCLFQMLVYIIHNGRKRTPLHMMLGHAIYARDRSKSLLTAFNRIGSCASYQTIRSSRSLLASYAVKCAEDGETPIPSTFTRTDYTMGGMDNSDYADKTSLSGTESSHYAALVLFQDSTIYKPLCKPPVSSTGLSYSNPVRHTMLPCQKVPDCVKPVVRPSLSPDMLLHPENKKTTLLDMQTARAVAQTCEFAICCIRIGLPSENPQIWAAVHTLVSSAIVPAMRVGFLPVIPKPITERATVRHCLTNFQSVRRQLNQESLAVWCDEGVFALAADIYLQETYQFRDIFLCLGPFHWTRVLLRCQGKLLRGSGVDDALIECGVFGPGVIESVLNGSHYVRALTGMLIVEDIIRSLQWQEFWCNKNMSTYPVLERVKALQIKLSANERCPEEFETLMKEIVHLHHEFLEFEKECNAKSEICQFLSVWMKLVTIVKNAVASDREGNWDLHVATVEDSMQIFAEFDCINYLRYGSWYLEQIKVLEFTHPELYRRFALGQWVVRDRPGWFCGIGGDMKVEQTIQRVSKGPGGHYVVGATRNAGAVAEFELLFHEIGSITNLLNLLTTNRHMDHTECQMQHALNSSRRNTFNENVVKLFDFMLERKNPFSVAKYITPVPLHNLLTKVAVDRGVAPRLLRCLENGNQVYQSYRQDRLVKKSKKISATIVKRKLPRFDDQPKTTAAATSKAIISEKKPISSKEVSEAQRNMEIAKERGMSLEQILSHDVLPSSPIFEGDLPTHVNKSKLVGEVEPTLDHTKWSWKSNLTTHVVVDFMSKLRQMSLGEMSTFGDVIKTIIDSASNVSDKIDYIHLILDSYVEFSVKEGERIRRRSSTTGIDIIGMNLETPIPRQLDKFWASENNKRNLQLLVQNMVYDLPEGSPFIVASGVVSDDEAIPAKASGKKVITDLVNWIEEADDRILAHVDWAVRIQQCKRVVIISNDTDTFALLLHYTPLFQSLGLLEIWQQYGTGEKRRMLPMHQAVSKLGTRLAKTIIKAHILTGDDCMSKVGTKHAALASDPEQYLASFGETDTLSEQDASLAEKYLVRVWAGARTTTTADTFDELRLENYTGSGTGIDALPPTSSVIKGHIQRGFFLVRKACCLLKNVHEPETRLVPLAYGWEEHHGTLIPTKYMKHLPQTLLTVCKCTGKCDTRRCRCRSSNVQCVPFCHGKGLLICENM